LHDILEEKQKKEIKMLLYERILFSSLFILTSLNISAFPPGGPVPSDPRPRITLYYHEHIFYDHPITYALFFTRMMLEKEIIVTDIRNRILQYCIYLKNKDFLEKFPYQKTWIDLCIPVQYQYLLTSQQLNTLGNVLLSNVFANKPKDSCTHKLYYRLPSKKDYELFLQLPVQLRICLTKLPTDPTKNINKKKELLVLNSSRTEYHRKPILPKKKKTKLLTLKKHKNGKK
jgi:hypothetical protein